MQGNTPHINQGINRRKLDRLFLAHGGQILPVNRTGELRYSHTSLPGSVKINGRRKDASRTLVQFVNRVVNT